jgi:transcriptional antiterminator RfaH
MRAVDPPALIPSDLYGKRWHVAVVKPQIQYREVAKRALYARGYSVLLPMCREMIVKDGESQAVEHPLYGRYVFVGVGSGRDSWDIRWTPGIQHLALDARRRPILIGIPVLEAIIARMQSDGGAVDLCPKPTAVPVTAVPIGSGFQEGQTVRVTGGPFAGWEALFQADQGKRCRVLLSLFGNQQTAMVPAKQLVAA